MLQQQQRDAKGDHEGKEKQIKEWLEITFPAVAHGAHGRETSRGGRPGSGARNSGASGTVGDGERRQEG